MPPSDAELKHLARHAGHLEVLINGNKQDGGALLKGASADLSKAVSTLVRLAAARGDVPMSDRRVKAFLKATNHSQRMKVLRGRGFGDFLKKVGSGLWKAAKFIAPIAIKAAPLIAAAL